MTPPRVVASRKVGTLTFDASRVDQAALAYSVDGVLVSKNVVRQTWSLENLAGTYSATWYFGCGSVVSYPNWYHTETIVEHRPDNSVTIYAAAWVAWYGIEHRLVGTYSQAGHVGQISTTVVAPDSLPGPSLTITEIEKTGVGFTGKFMPIPGYDKEVRIVAVQ